MVERYAASVYIFLTLYEVYLSSYSYQDSHPVWGVILVRVRGPLSLSISILFSRSRICTISTQGYVRSLPSLQNGSNFDYAFIHLRYEHNRFVDYVLFKVLKYNWLIERRRKEGRK